MPATNELLQEGRYRICEPTDGTGSVFEAFDTVRNKTVTVREIPVKLNKITSPVQQESLRAAFSAQAKALTEIDHDALMQVEDYFSEIDRQYLVMESVEGNNLRSLLVQNKSSFSLDDVTDWADNLLDALNYLHSRKPSIFHLNVRPENLTLDASGRVKLAGPSLENGDPSAWQMPSEQELRYSPMEQIWPGLDAASQKVITNSYDDRSVRILKEPADARSDIYSLGATLYFLMTGIEPVDPLERSIEMLEGKLDPLREPTQVNSQIPSEISDVLMKALEIRRENRYDSAAIMRHVLQAAIAKVKDREQENADIIRHASEAKRDAPVEEVLQTARTEDEVSDEIYTSEEDESEHEEISVSTAQLDDNLLEIPVVADEFAYRDTNVVDEDELAAVLEELEVAEAAVSQGSSPADRNTKRVQSAPVLDTPIQEFDRPVDTVPTTVEASDDEVFDEDSIFSETPKSGFPLPMPALVGAGVLGIVIAVGAWFAMSGSSETSAPPPAQTVQSVQPAQSDPTPASEPIASTQTEVPLSTNAPAASQVTAPKASPTAKPKKAEPAKPTAEKKKVTVDDLINDN